ncbi:hypothetical protein [Pedococcus sp. 5OH_020]|uniref:hypothetical protein n=1 Tax=Pedococcus sp. 5OH_020 TaxID=2989814 RepID=UPI0022E9999F|nr:hypothetical protein [Pedococcus sp. 5OH_020]
MSDVAVPRAQRLRRPGWGDVRLLVGVLLVLGSVVVGSVVVAHADDRTAMYVARTPLVPGQPLGAENLQRVDVQLGSQVGQYLSAAGELGSGRFVLRDVAPGELVPASAVGRQDQVGVQPLTLTVDAGAAAALKVGSRVDVYLNPADPHAGAAARAFTGPQLALRGVSVSSLPSTAGGLGASGSGDRPIQVMSPTEQIRDIIGKVDAGARVTVVPVAGTPLKVDQ